MVGIRIRPRETEIFNIQTYGQGETGKKESFIYICHIGAYSTNFIRKIFQLHHASVTKSHTSPTRIG